MIVLGQFGTAFNPDYLSYIRVGNVCPGVPGCDVIATMENGKELVIGHYEEPVDAENAVERIVREANY